jgi:hypothetical protein
VLNWIDSISLLHPPPDFVGSDRFLLVNKGADELVAAVSVEFLFGLTIGFVELRAADFVELPTANWTTLAADLMELIFGFVELVADFVGLTTPVDLTPVFGLVATFVEFTVDLDALLINLELLVGLLTVFVELVDVGRLATVFDELAGDLTVAFTGLTTGVTLLSIDFEGAASDVAGPICFGRSTFCTLQKFLSTLVNF